MQESITARMRTYFGLFMITLSSLMFENLLTRIFSVTLWYHFAFMAISIALFGMTVGSLIVYLLPQVFTKERVKVYLGLSSLLFAITAFFSILTHLSLPFSFDTSIIGAYSTLLTYLIIAIPFVFSGITVCLALTKFSGKVSLFYAADLVGAAVGCVSLVYVLKFTDGPTAALVVSTLACVGAIAFAFDAGNKRLIKASIIFSLMFATFAAGQSILVNQQASLLRLKWSKGAPETTKLYEKWNSFSRISVWGDPNTPTTPEPFGISYSYLKTIKVRQIKLDIDSCASTNLTAFNGDLSQVEFLKHDVSSFVNYLRPQSNFLIIGAGGGRDILAALAFSQKSVTAVEINEDIINIVNNIFGDFTGHLDKNPKVTFVNDEARSFIARSQNKYDIIQASLIDTFAASNAGAYVLTENSLYTVEAWEMFLNHLSSDGMLTFTRWYSEKNPNEMYRLSSLASASLLKYGINNPRDHILILGYTPPKEVDPNQVGLGTIIISLQPFTAAQITKAQEVAADLDFKILLSPTSAVNDTFSTIASGVNLAAFTAKYPFNIAPPTDNSPFFFYVERMSSILNQFGVDNSNLSSASVYVLDLLFFITIIITILCVRIPFLLSKEKISIKGAVPMFVFFIGIGLGYMLIELSQMQRLNIFLGHPTYSITVVLFSLLLSSGIGSYVTEKINNVNLNRTGILFLSLLISVLVIFGIITPQLILAFQASVTPIRILVAICTLFPLGFIMGTAFPLGMKIASRQFPMITPWLWGINGAASVLASVLAILIALNWGISIAFWMGFLCYLCAFFAFLRNAAQEAHMFARESTTSPIALKGHFEEV